MSNEIRFHEILKKLIQEKGITQTVLAEYLGIKPQTVSMYCSGKSYPEFHTIIKLASFFGVSIDYLITGQRQENKIIRKELGLSEQALENLKNCDRNLSRYISDLLSDKNFFQVFDSARKDFELEATYYPVVEDIIKDKYASYDFHKLMGTIELKAATNFFHFFANFFKNQNIIRSIKDREHYKELFYKNFHGKEIKDYLEHVEKS